jgi:AbrB family looped-hinge helix DNA binding protein
MGANSPISIALWYDEASIDQGGFSFLPKVTVSPKFQVVIPREVRKALRLRAGEQLQVFTYGDRIELVPVRPIREMRGFLKSLDTTVERDPDRL